MPCRSYDYDLYKARNIDAELDMMAYIHETIKDMDSGLHVRIPRDLLANYGAGADKSDSDRMAQILCRSCKLLEERGLADKVIYDGRNPMARKLADWWDKHKAEDAHQSKLQAKFDEVKQILENTFGDRAHAIKLEFGIHIFLTLGKTQIPLTYDQFMELYNIMTQVKNDSTQAPSED